MRKRNEILYDAEEISEDTRDFVKNLLDEIESDINLARDKLDTIKGIGDLDQICDAADILNDMSSAIY